MPTTRLINKNEELATLEVPWNRLAAGEPMRSWTWLATWWKHYQHEVAEPGRNVDRELHVLAVFDEPHDGQARLIGLAPWYLEHSIVKGNVIRPLGSGHVCTDHLSLICEPADEERVASAVADYLTSRHCDWDRLELPAIDANDPAISHLVVSLTDQNCLISSRPAGNCWIATLPNSWDAYFTGLAQSRRRQLRRWRERYVAAGRVQLHEVTREDELQPAWNVLVDLHQRRWQGLGEPGCFASPAFCGFHREVVSLLLATGQLRMSWLGLDGSPIAAEYHLVGRETVYTYQSGIDPDRLQDAPGRLAYMLSIERAIAAGYKRIDFLRGDEPYKSHWRAEPAPIYDYRVYVNRPRARLQGLAINAAVTFKDWVKQSVELVSH
jgi:CelD/BcsL family acetyltransferase involved in cellulose biosynthesis